jgi:thioredoxin
MAIASFAAMTTVNLDFEMVKNAIESKDGILLIDFWAAWCGPCRAFAPIYERVAEDHPDITFGKVDTQAEQMLAASFGIRSIPTLMAFRDGILVFSQAGLLPEPVLRDLVSQIEGLDMDEVRREIAEAEVAESAAAS